MKRLILASLGWAVLAGPAFAQNNGGYVDDVYYNGSMAQQDAKTEAKKQKKQQNQQGNTEYYNSSSNYRDSYDEQAYRNDYYEEESYIDYDDDSYTSRIRRFQYPMAGVGYWGGIYSPFWNSPFYANPFYGWGGWYTPGFSISMGWGGGPYWNNFWGMNAWYGYGGFNSWYMPFGGWGWGGYGAGFWNGYYAGWHDAGFYGGGYGRPAVYGPRGGRTGMSVGSYGRSARIQPYDRGSNMVQPLRGTRGNTAIQNGNTAPGRNAAIRSGRAGFQTGESRNANSRGAAIRLDNTSREIEANPNATRSINTDRPQNRGGLFNRNRNVEQQRPIQRDIQQNSAPRFNNSQPAQRYSPSPAPSRNFSAPSSPGRMGGGGFGGGGGRSGGGGRR